ncbi:MAG: lipocalin family protein [Bacteroidota bacterium]|nr:lipocalin family protein [Bacteroidota bacterium]
MKKTIIILIIMTLTASLNAQKKISVVPTVDLKRYAGKWYEIARKPFSFETKLKCITATYTLREDGRINVENAGVYISKPGKTSIARGKAFIPDKNTPAKLKVQFFWPFKGDYWILYLDENYRYVLIGEPSLRYLWVLAREKKLEEAVLKMLLEKASSAGYDITDLIMTVQDCS